MATRVVPSKCRPPRNFHIFCTPQGGHIFIAARTPGALGFSSGRRFSACVVPVVFMGARPSGRNAASRVRRRLRSRPSFSAAAIASADLTSRARAEWLLAACHGDLCLSSHFVSTLKKRLICGGCRSGGSPISAKLFFFSPQARSSCFRLSAIHTTHIGAARPCCNDGHLHEETCEWRFKNTL